MFSDEYVIVYFTGTIAIIIVFILKSPVIGGKNGGKNVEWLFYITLPNFCFINGLQELYNNYNNELVHVALPVGSRTTTSWYM